MTPMVLDALKEIQKYFYTTMGMGLFDSDVAGAVSRKKNNY